MESFVDILTTITLGIDLVVVLGVVHKFRNRRLRLDIRFFALKLDHNVDL